MTEKSHHSVLLVSSGDKGIAAITRLLESNSFEDAIRNAISLGGDSDTLAAITGSIAEAAYGIPEEIRAKAYTYLDEPLKDVIRRWERYSKDHT